MLPLGTLIDDKYEVDGHIGEGGMGFVVSAKHVRLGTKVAVKFLHAHAATLPEFVERFQQEARAASTIASEHVVRVSDVGTMKTGEPFIVMEYLQGRDLATELEKRGPLPFTEVAGYLLEACEGLAHAHRARILHRDLKPANLFLAEQNGRTILKVLDFGISKNLNPDTDAHLTATSAMLGTALYMAPEQLRKRKDVDERVDVWALGVILYELVSGNVPFIGESLPEIITLILDGEFPPLENCVQGLPPAFVAVVNTCLCVDRDERFRTVTDLAQALAPFAKTELRSITDRISLIVPPVGAAERKSRPPSTGALGALSIGQAKTGPVSDAPKQPSRSGRVFIGLGAALVTIAGGIGFWWSLAPHHDAPAAHSEPSVATQQPTPTAPSLAAAAQTLALPEASLSPSQSATAETAFPKTVSTKAKAHVAAVQAPIHTTTPVGAAPEAPANQPRNNLGKLNTVK
jgi:eukaryotic-like serine/threonine-protein kinase